jgi:hypothetical protein
VKLLLQSAAAAAIINRAKRERERGRWGENG